jgi:uncharacterized protein YdhG (YjbR/CyaY superfamily)
MAMKSYKDVPSYIAAAPKEARAMLRQMRGLIRKIAPGAVEKIGYGMPGYAYRGRPFAYFGAFNDHVSFFPASGTFLKAYAAALKKYKTGKGTVRFPYGELLPVALLARMLRDKRSALERGARKK